MGKVKTPTTITERDVGCMENLVVAYNTVFLMSSIFIVSIAGTAQDLFSDFHRLLSPSALLLIVGGFTLLVAGLGYVGVGKRSSNLISMYTMLLTFIFVMEIIAGLGILSFRGEIRSVLTNKMKKAAIAYPHDPKIANLVDYVQLEMKCCGVTNYSDWDGILDRMPSNCIQNNIVLPQSCCTTYNTTQTINPRGCLPALNFMLHKSSLLLSTTVIALCTIQILGAYFAYSLSSAINKFKIQKLAESQQRPSNEIPEIPIHYREKY